MKAESAVPIIDDSIAQEEELLEARPSELTKPVAVPTEKSGGVQILGTELGMEYLAPVTKAELATKLAELAEADKAAARRRIAAGEKKANTMTADEAVTSGRISAPQILGTELGAEYSPALTEEQYQAKLAELAEDTDREEKRKAERALIKKSWRNGWGLFS